MLITFQSAVTGGRHSDPLPQGLGQSLPSRGQADNAGLQVWHPDAYFAPASHIPNAPVYSGPPPAEPKSDPAAAALAAENENLKLQRSILKRRNTYWIAGLIAVIIIIVAVGGGLTGKFLHRKGSDNSGGTLATQSSGKTVWAQSAFVTLVSSAGGVAIYSTITTSEPIIPSSQAGTNSAANAVAATTIIAVPPLQGNWRYCQNCHSMFYNGFSTSGVCLSGGGHVAQGFLFDLPHDVATTTSTQDQWRYCQKCYVMFYNGDTDKGRCAAVGAHEANGYVFVLPHDIPSTLSMQNQWRYCNKCRTMFYDGYSAKGLCPLGGGHTANGFDFVLPHDLYGNRV
jgi:RNase P subunit RPR2